MKMQQNGGKLDAEGFPQGTRLWHTFLRIGEWSHVEKGKVWQSVSKYMDSPIMLMRK